MDYCDEECIGCNCWICINIECLGKCKNDCKKIIKKCRAFKQGNNKTE